MAYQYTRLGGPLPTSSRRFPLLLGGSIFLILICTLFWWNGAPNVLPSSSQGYSKDHSSMPAPTLATGDNSFDRPSDFLPSSAVEPDNASLTPSATASVPVATATSGPSDAGEQFENPVSLICPDDPLSDEIFVVLKTGATAARERLPVHFYTTLRCVKNYAIFSDLEEKIEGHRVYDTFDTKIMINETVMDEHEEFGLYRELQELHSEHAGADEIEKLQEGDGPIKEDGRGWKLDKWKFLPMIDKTLELAPEAKWYLFIEADSFIIWSNLVRWLKNFDADKPWYLGGQAMLGDLVFGHGGTGYLISNPAAVAFAKQVRENQEHYVERVDSFCCGDANVADVFRDLDIPLHGSWPTLQGETPSTLDYTDRQWCWAAVSYHHMTPRDITAMWEFEQRWLASENGSQPILHSDVFHSFVKPLMDQVQEGWDNLSKDRVYNMDGLKEPGNDDPSEPPEEEALAHMSLEKCQAVCELHSECKQYQYEPGSCSLGHAIRLGGRSDNPELKSGWMSKRVDELMESLEPCSGALWSTD